MLLYSMESYKLVNDKKIKFKSQSENYNEH